MAAVTVAALLFAVTLAQQILAIQLTSDQENMLAISEPIREGAEGFFRFRLLRLLPMQQLRHIRYLSRHMLLPGPSTARSRDFLCSCFSLFWGSTLSARCDMICRVQCVCCLGARGTCVDFVFDFVLDFVRGHILGLSSSSGQTTPEQDAAGTALPLSSYATPYAMTGTDMGYAATHPRCDLRYRPTHTPVPT
eukprot:793713-Rhodomonas_salina.1